MAWLAGTITVDGVAVPGLIKRQGDTLRVETEGKLTEGQTFTAFDREWEVTRAQVNAYAITHATCAPKSGKPVFKPDYPKQGDAA